VSTPQFRERTGNQRIVFARRPAGAAVEKHDRVGLGLGRLGAHHGHPETNVAARRLRTIFRHLEAGAIGAQPRRALASLADVAGLELQGAELQQVGGNGSHGRRVRSLRAAGRPRAH